jgi:hypothetical protein
MARSTLPFSQVRADCRLAGRDHTHERSPESVGESAPAGHRVLQPQLRDCHRRLPALHHATQNGSSLLRRSRAEALRRRIETLADRLPAHAHVALDLADRPVLGPVQPVRFEQTPFALALSLFFALWLTESAFFSRYPFQYRISARHLPAPSRHTCRYSASVASFCRRYSLHRRCWHTASLHTACFG